MAWRTTRPLLLGASLAMAWPTTAHAYRTFADDPEVQVAARHTSDTVRWDLVSSADVDVVEPAAIRAFATWSTPECTGFAAEYVGRTAAAAAPRDGRNTIEIVTSGWVARGFQAGRGASTDVQLRVLDGPAGRQAEIAEADLYLNFDEFTFGRPGSDRSDLDLDGVLVHEVGHMAIGLLHPCETVAGVAPACESTPEARLSTMYPEYLGESQRMLGADDLSAVCALYPAEGCPSSCAIGFRCEAGACLPCTADDCSTSECRGPECDPEPNTLCSAEMPCLAGVCARFGVGMGTCVRAGALGADCTVPTQCDSRLCVVRVAPTTGDGYCSTRCMADGECSGPSQFCSADNVCEPRPGGPSCSVGHGRGPRPLAGLMIAVFLWVVRRRRR